MEFIISLIVIILIIVLFMNSKQKKLYKEKSYIDDWIY